MLLCVCKIQSLTLKEEHNLRVTKGTENNVGT